MNFYVLATKAMTPWAHKGGQFVPLSQAPAGAYPITETEYAKFNYYVALGIPLQWYPNQRPYVTMPWMQPVFTDSNRASDGSLIRASSESIQYGNPAYRAMDGNKTATSDGYFWSTNNSTTGWWRVDFPYAIRLTKLTHYNRYNATYADITGRYYTDPSRSVPLGDAFSLSGSWTPLVVYDSAENPIRTRGIFFEKTDGSVWSGIGELELEATEMAYEAGEGR